MAYKIDLDAIERYIDYLRKLKKKLEKDLADFDKALKDAHNHWDDNNYALTIKAKDSVALEQKKLIAEIDRSLKNLKQMYEEYDKYLRRK